MAEKKVEKIIWDAEFTPKVKTYWLLNGALVLFVSIIGIPLIPFWFIFGSKITGRYLNRMRCTLTEKNVRVSKGILVRVEKTVPLDKITDMGLVQGPIMRLYGLHALSLETAGQSSAGSLIKLEGIKDVETFREAVLSQRDTLAAKLTDGSPSSTALPAMSAGTTEALLAEIRDTLQRIEGKLGEKG